MNEMDKKLFFEFIGGLNQYMLLDRMKSDCLYWLGYGARHDKYLWAGNAEKQIQYMKWLWESFADDQKPEWLTMEEIEELEKRMASAA